MNKYRLIQYLFYVTLSCLIIGNIVILLRGGAISSFLFMNMGLPEKTALVTENIFSICLLIIGIWLMFNPLLFPAMLLSVLLLLLSLAVFLSGGKHYAEWAIPAQFLRITFPLLFYLYLNMHKKYAIAAFKIVIAVVFITHGLEAIGLNPVFLDYLFLNLPFNLDPENATLILRIIGYMDIVVALLALINYKPAIYWLFIWGFLTALLRIIDGGWVNYPEFLVRVPHFTVPLSLILMFAKDDLIVFLFRKKEKRATSFSNE